VSFLVDVYRRVLDRQVDAPGLSYFYFGPLTGSAAGRTQLVRQIEASPEAAQLAVRTIYQDTLGRTPDAGGLAQWAGQLERGVAQTTVLAGVLGSDEFVGRMQSYVANLNTGDPNVAASQFIAAAGLFRSQPRVVPVVALPAPSPPSVNGDNGHNPGVVVAPGGDGTGAVPGNQIDQDQAALDNYLQQLQQAQQEREDHLNNLWQAQQEREDHLNSLWQAQQQREDNLNSLLQAQQDRQQLADFLNSLWQDQQQRADFLNSLGQNA
jgi:hypothetical protein